MSANDLTPFDVLMRDNAMVLPSLWQAMFEETEERLLAVAPEGVDLLDVGRAAWDCLPAEAQAEALDALIYGWWETYQDLKARAAFSEGGAR